MARDLKSILKLRVPVIVRIGQRRLPMDNVLGLSPGAIIELPKPAERPLDLLVNNKVIGIGNAVKIGENFGLRVLEVGDPADRVHALTTPESNSEPAPPPPETTPEPAPEPAETHADP